MNAKTDDDASSQGKPLPAACIDLTIENVRRIERALLSLRLGSRTVVVGRNNSGKTTILDMMARSLWSLPGHFDDKFRQFHVSWYRREGTRFVRPRAVVDLPAAVLDESLCKSTEARLVFEQLGNASGRQVTRSDNRSLSLVTIGCKHVVGSTEIALAELAGDPWIDLWQGGVVQLVPALLSEAEWGSPLETTPQSIPTIGARFYDWYSANTPLSRAVSRFCRRVFYLPASRAPGFQTSPNLIQLSQDNLFNVSSLLLSLRATEPEAFQGVGAALGAIFPEVCGLRLDSFDGGVVPEIQFSDGRVEYAGNLGFGLQNALHSSTGCSRPRCITMFFGEESSRTTLGPMQSRKLRGFIHPSSGLFPVTRIGTTSKKHSESTVASPTTSVS